MNFYEDTSYLSFGSHFYTFISLIRDCYIYKHFQKYTQRLTQSIVTWGRQQKSNLSSYISKLWQASILIILYFTFKRWGRYGHDLDHVERIDWILLGVKQGYLNLYFTIIGNIAGSRSVDQAVFKLIEIHLALPPESWDQKQVLLCTAGNTHIYVIMWWFAQWSSRYIENKTHYVALGNLRSRAYSIIYNFTD